MLVVCPDSYLLNFYRNLSCRRVGRIALEWPRHREAARKASVVRISLHTKEYTAITVFRAMSLTVGRYIKRCIKRNQENSNGYYQVNYF